jgi:hypothetical protein
MSTPVKQQQPTVRSSAATMACAAQQPLELIATSPPGVTLSRVPRGNPPTSTLKSSASAAPARSAARIMAAAMAAVEGIQRQPTDRRIASNLGGTLHGHGPARDPALPLAGGVNDRGMIASSFSLVDRRPVPALGVEVSRYRHPCGAEHWHLGSADEHRAFAVAFRTPPSDSTGLPHILEHTTLCGSRRYPVRDPFFQMLRRSLQTFMNAMTFPDLTAYPFASQVPKDFDNLLAVYLDAVFAPNLHPLDFAQEGHRLEPDGTAWARKGVVYNEMKGAMDSTDAQMEAARERFLLADTIYRHNSGGEPSDIPRLTHRDLVDFHRRCYRPANACFITYGNADPARLHAAFAAYIGDDAGAALPPPTASRLAGPFADIDVPVPLAEGQDPLDATSVMLTWVQGDTADLDEVLAAELVDRLLLGHAGAPLRRALEGRGRGRSTGGRPCLPPPRQRGDQHTRHEPDAQRPGRRAIRLRFDPILQVRELSTPPRLRVAGRAANRVTRGVLRRAEMLFHLLRAGRGGCAVAVARAARARSTVLLHARVPQPDERSAESKARALIPDSSPPHGARNPESGMTRRNE